MRIKKLLIRNLGRHKYLEKNLDGSVIGLLGPNGSGKSTILKIIHFLFTGWTPAKETQESFIRKVDPSIEQVPVQGFAEIEFYAQGSVYRLSRAIGSPSSRKLAKLDDKGNPIKDETFTRAEEIIDTLNDVLGVDKYAMDNAVFPEQGRLDKILFGNQSEREELLVKLLLLGHMQKVADIAAGKIKVLSAEIQDFSSLYDELQSSRNIAESELASAENILLRTRSYEQELTLFQEWSKIIDSINASASLLLNYKNNVRTNEKLLHDELHNLSKSLSKHIGSVSYLEKYVQEISKEISNIRKDVNDNYKLRADYIEYIGLLARLDNNKKELAKASADCPNYIPQSVIDDLNARIKAQTNREIYKKELEQAIVEGKKNKELVAKLAEESNKLSKEIEKLEDKIKEASNEASLFKTITDTCSLALESACSTDCPVCGETFSISKIKDRLKVYTDKLKETNKNISVLNFENNNLNSKLRTTEHELTQRQTLLQIFTKKYKENKTLLDSSVEEVVTHLIAEVTKLTEQNSKRNEIIKIISNINIDISYVDIILSKYSEEDKKKFSTCDLGKIDKNIKDLDEELTIHTELLNKCNEVNVSCARIASAINTDTNNINNLDKTIENNKKKADDIYSSFPVHLTKIVEDTEINTVEFLRDKNKAFTEQQAKTKQLKTQADNIKRRLLEIENKIKLDEEKRNVIAELQKIVSAFSRQGIPMAYVQHKFDSLISMTQENLEIMDANFAIAPNPDKPVSIIFSRLDEPGQVTFEHDKLSGGQKVRLSIAFLLAVQQLVIPDLGFLVLDEPSTHLDEESRENLKELLINLGQQLEASDTQILVCDHAKELEPAFNNFILL